MFVFGIVLLFLQATRRKYRLEALASRLIIGMASWLMVKLVVVGVVGL